MSAAAEAFGTPEQGWLDLSTGINPLPYPIDDAPADIWQRLPVKADAVRLIDAARSYYGVPDEAALAIAPGTQSIIQWLPVLRETCCVQVLGPTYEEHAARWRAVGHDVDIIDDFKKSHADILIIVNPNNPDGRTIGPDDLIDCTEHQAAKGGLLIVDEAFADVVPEISVIPACGRPGLLVLRSFGKFFGLAGLRLGFAVGQASDIAQLEAALGHWCVAGPALSIGARALADTDWQERTRTRLSEDAARLDQILRDSGFDIVGGTSLYRLARKDDARTIYEKLGRTGILVRIFDTYPEWLRFGLPGTEDGWQRLERALAIQNP
ncbi:threonine-phosphate decarboxylase CobD [Thalassospiraceae bacterium LMO-JJ14]|nr:threonine-phosphate decarboxylase CobD [Thalassospiraceae bacterium LMO-JJ14]